MGQTALEHRSDDWGTLSINHCKFLSIQEEWWFVSVRLRTQHYATASVGLGINSPMCHDFALEAVYIARVSENACIEGVSNMKPDPSTDMGHAMRLRSISLADRSPDGRGRALIIITSAADHIDRLEAKIASLRAIIAWSSHTPRKIPAVHVPSTRPR